MLGFVLKNVSATNFFRECAPGQKHQRDYAQGITPG